MSRLGGIVSSVVLASGVLFAFWEPLRALVALWSNVPMYSYGFTVPVISLYLLWTRREDFGTVPLEPARFPAAALLLLASGLLFVGKAAGLLVVQQLAFVVALVGALLGVFGIGFVRVGWAGLTYLLLMVPIWDGLTEPLHWPFQLRSASLGASTLRAIGIPAYIDGTMIALPNITLEVARACSGVNYLVAVAALGLPLAYLYLRGTWKRVVLIAAAVLVAALSNGLRVALIGLLAYLQLGSPLHGPLHVLHGLFVAAIGYIVLFAGLHWLSEPAAARAVAVRHESRWRVRPIDTLVLAIAFWSLGMLARAHRVEPVSLTRRLELPIVLGRWVGDPSQNVLTLPGAYWPGADQEIRRGYKAASGDRVNVYVGYFAVQEAQRELGSFLSDELHHDAVVIPLRYGPDGRLSANYVPHVRKNDALAVFWYEIDGIVETSRFGVKMRTAWNSLAYRRSNAAVVMLWCRTSDAAQPRAELEEMAGAVYAALGGMLPGRGGQGAAIHSERRELIARARHSTPVSRSAR